MRKIGILLLILSFANSMLAQRDSVIWVVDMNTIDKFDERNKQLLDSIARFNYEWTDKYQTITGVYYYINGFSKSIYFEFKRPIPVLGNRMGFQNSGNIQEILPEVKQRKLRHVQLIYEDWNDYLLRKKN